jgi:cation transport ATPase
MAEAIPDEVTQVSAAPPMPVDLARAPRAEAMPFEPSVSCPVCRVRVDPLRARAVLALETGFRYFCGRDCLDTYRTNEPSRRLATAAHGSEKTGARGEELVQEVITRPVQLTSISSPFPTWVPWLVLPATALGFWPDDLVRAVSAIALGVSLLVVLMASRIVREELSLFAFVLPTLGVAGLLSAALALRDPWLLTAAGLAVCTCYARELLAQQAEAPLSALLSELASRVPLRSRVSLIDAQDEQRHATRHSATESVRAGEEVLVEAGEVVPVDGVVARGEATVLPHAAAREPVPRGPGQALLAGARVLTGSLHVTATRVGAARALFRPLSFGQDMSPGAASVVRAVARAKGPLSLTLYALISAALALTFGASIWHAGAAFGAALLVFPVVSLVRGVRLSFVAGSALGASRGIVFRDAAALERAGRVNAAALSTDGTVTLGTPSLMEVSSLSREQSSEELTALAMGAEMACEEHPIARAIARYGAAHNISPASLRRVAYARGSGVSALVEGGGALVLGNRQALLNAGVSVAVADRDAQRAEAMGRSVIFMSVGGRARALFVLEDPVRPEARSAVQTLIDLGVEVVLLGGDHRATVEALARPLDITHIKAELSAEERAQEVTRLREAGVVVAAIGRAPEDELAFATADVALTLDAAGGVHEGDIAVGSNDLRDAADALVLSQRTRRNVQAVLSVTVVGGLTLAAVSALSVGHPALTLALALAIDAWALPSPVRLLRKRKRSFGATRSGTGLQRPV